MSGLNRSALKEQLVQAIYDVLDELECSPQYGEMDLDKEANVIADAVFQVITDTNDEDMASIDDYVDDEPSEL